jgi:hypothetical protein
MDSMSLFLSGQRISHTASKQSFTNSPSDIAVRFRNFVSHKITCFCSCFLSTALLLKIIC